MGSNLGTETGARNFIPLGKARNDSDVFFQPFPCKWVKCLEPEEPDSFLGLKREWNGIPVPFWENVTYTCQPGFYFIDDRERLSFSVMCKDNGEFEYPSNWPMCIRGIVFLPCLEICLHFNTMVDSYCVTPPPKPRGGERIWNQQNNYGTEVM